MLDSAAQSIRFFSPEFFKNMIDQLNADESLAKLTKGMNTSLLLSCNELSLFYLINITEGRLSVKQSSSDQVAEFAFSAPYTEWEKIARGQAKIPSEVVSGRIKFKGSMPKMLLYLNKVLGLESRIMKSINSMSLIFNP
jgi:putative sterol carrier protein